MKTSFHGLKVAKSSTGFYVGRYFQEDEAITRFVRLTDAFSSKQEAIEWIDSKMEEVAEREEGKVPLFWFLPLKSVPKSMENSRLRQESCHLLRFAPND